MNASSQPRRTRRRRKRAPLLPFFLLLLIALALLGRFVLFSSLFSAPADLPQQTREELAQLARSDSRVSKIMDHLDRYPTQLLELVARNPETAQFVLDYPEVKDDPPGETVGQVTKGTFPLLMQWDSRWGYQTYGDGLMALNGCGPTALAMVICGLTGDDTVTPWTVAQYADQQGYYVDGAGSSWDLMRTGCEHFGLTARELPLDKGVLNAALNKGQPVICSVGPGDFTTSGHFILLTGVEDGKYKVNDPNRHSTSQQLWDYDTLAPQIRNLWAYSLA